MSATLANLELRLAFSVEWTCGGCGEPRVTLKGFDPPQDRRCHGCRSVPPPVPGLSNVLASAGVPGELCRLALDRTAWEGHFERPWPAKLAAWPGREKVTYAWGPTGTGKSSAAAVLLGELLLGDAARDALSPPAAPRALFAYGPLLLHRMRMEFEEAGGRRLMDRLLTVPVLVVDEPLAARLTDWAAGELLTLFGSREIEGLATFVTSNLAPTALLPAVQAASARGRRAAAVPPCPPALASRLLSGTVVAFEGEDVRLRRKQRQAEQ